MTEKYFTPSIEDIRVGYECEYIHKWYEIKGDDNIYHEEWRKPIISFKNIALYVGETMKGLVRVPYLTKEQIEAEGFIDQLDRGMSENYGALFVGRNKNVRYWFTNKRLSINGMGSVFDGECKDINTFRYICKLLGI